MQYPRERLCTERDLAELPDDEQRHELAAGFLIAEPQPFPRHAQVQVRIVAMLDGFARPRGLGQVLSASGFLLARDPDTVRGPDIAFVRADRWSGADRDRFFRGAPDLAVEIVSPSNRPSEMHAKAADYLSAGCPLVWVVDPKPRVATVYRTLLTPRRLFSDDVLDGGDVLPGFAIRVGEIFED